MRASINIRGYTIVDDIKINGKLTNGEDLADLGGTLLAYLAWKEETKDQKLDPVDGSDARSALLHRLRPELVHKRTRRK